MKLRQVIALGLVIAVAGDSGCRRSSKPQNRVVLYASVDDVIARPIIAAFEKQTGIRVDVLFDSEAKKTTGLVERLRAERNRPQADVFWSSECFMTIDLAREGGLDEHVSEATADWPRKWRDGQRRWFAFAARARVIAYSPARVKADELPRTWMDLAAPKWKGRIAMADPRFGTTGGHLGAMLAYGSSQPELGEAAYPQFIDGLAANDVRVLASGNAGVVRAIGAGERDLGMTDTDDVWAAREQGADVHLIYARHDDDEQAAGGGTLLIPNTVARVKGGPNPEAAAKLIDFLLSAAVERALAESTSHNLPLRAELAAEYPQYAVADPLQVDYEQAAVMRQAAVDLGVKRLMEKRAAERISEVAPPGDGDAR